MMRLASIGVLLLWAQGLFAQPFGNEWIDFNNTYLKFPVAQQGVYRLNYSELNSALGLVGMSPSGLDPRNVQVFFRGKEQFVLFVGEQDGSLDPGDYLLLWAQGNDGFSDTSLYLAGRHHPNPHYNLFSDTAWYYITWNNSTSNKRYRIQPKTNAGGRSAVSWVMTESHVEQHSYYNEGERDFYSVSTPLYIRGEGWMGQPIGYQQTLTVQIPTPNPYNGSGAPRAILRGTVAGASNPSVVPNHRLGIDFGASAVRLLDTSYNAYAMVEYNFSLAASQITSGYTPLFIKSLPLSVAPPVDRQCFGYTALRYAHSTNLNGESSLLFEIPQSSDSVYLRFQNFSASVDFIWDLEAGYALSVQQTSGEVRALATAGNARRALVFDASAYRLVTGLRPVVNLRDGNGKFTDYSALQPDSALLMVTWQGLFGAVAQYAAARSTNGMDALPVYVEDLFEQFAFGINKSPVAIRNFALYMHSVCMSKPSHLFLVGKGIKSNLARSGLNYSNNRVPVMGVPPSDNLLTTPLDGSDFAPLIPTGRLVAHSAVQVADYSAKAMEMLAVNDDLSALRQAQHWKKVVLHFAGGNDAFEQGQLLGYLNNYKSVLEDTLFGGRVYTFERFQSGAIQNLRFDTIQTLINSGASLLSFFGHGSGGQLGIDIGDPSEYNNRGKYGLFVANSCNVGDFFEADLSGLTINERWTLAKNGGVGAFISSTSVGYATTLNIWNSIFFRRLSRDNYGASIGHIMRRTSEESSGGSFFLNRACLEINLHGDPSLPLYPRLLPDFEIGADRVQTPTTVSVDEGSFDIRFTVANLGRGIIADVPIEIKRQFPQGGDTVYRLTISGIPFEQTVVFRVPLGVDGETGENIFSITVNPNQMIEEIHPIVNNTVSNIRINLSSDEILPVYPYKNAIVPITEFSFQAVCADIFRKEGEYMFELDTVPEFTSPALRQGRVSANSSVVGWEQTLPYLKDSAVYFWRCSPSDKNPNKRKWRSSSFRYIMGKEGWSQAHRGQFSPNEKERVTMDASGQFSFESGTVKVACDNKGNPANNAEYSSIRYSVNGVQQGRVSVCQGLPSMLIVVIDPTTLLPWETYWTDNSVSPPVEYNANRRYGNYNDPANSTCPQRDRRFMFRVSDAAEMDSMVKLITQIVPDSFYILAHSAVRASFKDTTKWQNRHFAAFESLGADSIRYIPDDYPYIFFTQRGNPSKSEEMIGKSPTDYLLFSTLIQARSGSASMLPEPAGPTKDWKWFEWNYKSLLPSAYNEIDLQGLSVSGGFNSLKRIPKDRHDLDLRRDVAGISSYSYLRTESRFTDADLQTTPQLVQTNLYYKEVPELTVDPGAFNFFKRDTLRRGEALQLVSGISNLSHIDADSLRVKISVTDVRGEEHLQIIHKTPVVAAFKTISDSMVINTRGLAGSYILHYEINPTDSLWQPEKAHFNNRFSRPFFVVNDRTNPLMDITFDGRKILDGDIVSARPDINITVKDDNPFMMLDDTSLVDVWLVYPDKKMERLPYFSNDERHMLHFSPAGDQSNKAQINFKPIFNRDGVYTLRTQSRDVSGNEAGKYDYEINFEVINRSTITHVMNYPNPFTTATRFVFTLTGWKIPDVFSIQILSVSGRVVREIRREELGSIYIGRNISDFVWNGTDEFGDRLANGVYFYRVITKIDGETIERRESGADGYFKKDFGKMYLMR
jgi:hypothetical protein